jgi:hypothetical protein
MTVTKFDTRPMLNEVSLHKASLWRADGDLRGEKITCTAGQIWVTQENDLNDYVLNPGEIFWVTRSGTLLVQALVEGQFSFSRFIAPGKPERN